MSKYLNGQTVKFAVLALGTLLATTTVCARPGADIDPIEVITSPIELDSEVLQHDGVGRLIWWGGLEVTSSDDRFGGFSGLLVSADGAHLLAVSDRGRWFSARLGYGPDGRLVRLQDGKIGRLRDLDGEVLEKKKWRDAESLTAFEDGTTLVSFEGKHRIWLYGPPLGTLNAKPTSWPQPQGLDDLPKNRGLEALVALQNGELLALVQDRTDDPSVEGFLWRENRWWPLKYQLPEKFEPKGATRLPDGDVLVLESGKLDPKERVIRLVRVPASDIRPRAHLQGRELARLNAPFGAHNFEGLGSREGVNGETLIYLLSDNDFDEGLKTQLLMFALED